MNPKKSAVQTPPAWETMRTRLKEDKGEEVFNAFLQALNFETLKEDGTLVLSTPVKNYRLFISQTYGAALLKAARLSFPEAKTVVVTVREPIGIQQKPELKRNARQEPRPIKVEVELKAIPKAHISTESTPIKSAPPTALVAPLVSGIESKEETAAIQQELKKCDIIIHVVSDYYGTKRSALTNPIGTQYDNWQMQAALYLARIHTSLKNEQIALKFGDQLPKTVEKLFKHVENQIINDQGRREQLNYLTRSVKYQIDQMET